MMSRLLLTTSSYKSGHHSYLCCLIKSLNACRQWFPALRAHEMIIVCGTVYKRFIRVCKCIMGLLEVNQRDAMEFCATFNSF